MTKVVSVSARERRRCFVVVATGLDTGGPQPASRPSRSLTAHGPSTEKFRRAAMAAVPQVGALFLGRNPACELLAVNLESNAARDLPPSPYAWQVLKSLMDSDGWWLAARGRLSGTFDGARLAAQIRRDAAGVFAPSDALVVVTNHELTPPAGLRYLVRVTDAAVGQATLSAAQLDPDQTADAPDRFVVLQRRLRAALAGVVGELLGIPACDDPVCVMQRGVDSVAILDEMTGIGSEHAADGLAGAEFELANDGPQA